MKWIPSQIKPKRIHISLDKDRQKAWEETSAYLIDKSYSIDPTTGIDFDRVLRGTTSYLEPLLTE